MKKRVISLALAAVLTILLVFGASAAEPAYENDFSSGSIKITEWKTLNLDPDSNGAWDIADVGGNKLLRGQIAKFNDSILYYKAKKFKDVTIEADITLERGNAVGVIGRMDAEARGYQVIFDQFDGIKLCKRPYYMFKSGGMIDVGSEYHIVFSMIGSKIKAQITSKKTGETLSLEVEDETFTGAGYVGFSIFGFDTDAKSNAVGLVDNVKIYEGEVAPTDPPTTIAPTTTAGGGTATTPPTGGEGTTAPPTQDGENTTTTAPVEADFALSSKYTDATVDNTGKTVTLSRKLNVSEIKDTFKIPDGYTLKVLDKSGAEITDNAAEITADMKLSFVKDGAPDQVYAIKMEAAAQGDSPESDGGNWTWLIIVIVVIVVAGAGVGGFFLFRYLKAKKAQPTE